MFRFKAPYPNIFSRTCSAKNNNNNNNNVLETRTNKNNIIKHTTMSWKPEPIVMRQSVKQTTSNSNRSSKNKSTCIDSKQIKSQTKQTTN